MSKLKKTRHHGKVELMEEMVFCRSGFSLLLKGHSCELEKDTFGFVFVWIFYYFLFVINFVV